MNIQQHLQNQEEIDKLRVDNAELKKNLEREQLLHTMLYKEWKELNDRLSAREQEEVNRGKSKNLFYKYAFFVVLASAIPAYYFLIFNKENGKIPVSSRTESVVLPSLDSSSAKISREVNDSSITANKNVISNKDTAEQQKPLPPPEVVTPPVVKHAKPEPVVTHEEKIVTADANKTNNLTFNKPEVEGPLSGSTRDSIYWLGWNSYYQHTGNPFTKRSSERYQVWLDGWNAGKSDAKKVLTKDSVQK